MLIPERERGRGEKRERREREREERERERKEGGRERSFQFSTKSERSYYVVSTHSVAYRAN
jgi:hypothetical protein